jgi:hypothetical protein
MRGIDTKITMQHLPNKADIGSQEVFDSLFYRFRGGQKNHSEIAKKIVIAAAKGPDHLHDEKRIEMAKELGISDSVYGEILKKLKSAGWIRKHGSVYKATRTFIKHCRRFAAAAQNFGDDIGIPLEEETNGPG